MTPEELKDLKEGFHEMDKRMALLEQKVDQMSKDLSKMTDALSWIAKILGAGLLTAVITWVVRGGLAGG